MSVHDGMCGRISRKGAFQGLVGIVLLMAAGAARASFTYCSEITVSGYTGSETLEGFPVLMRISPERVPGFKYTLCRADGLDIRFTSTDGAMVYPHEVEYWTTNGESFVWVRLPSVSGTTTKFRFEFGDASYTTVPDATAVWSSSAGGAYAAVWHFGETATAATAKDVSAADSAKMDPSAANMDAVPMGAKLSEMVSVDGQIGLARWNSQGSLNRYEASDYQLLGVGETFTVSFWMRLERVSSSYYYGLVATTKNMWRSAGGIYCALFCTQTQIKVFDNDAGGAYLDVSDLLNRWAKVTIVYTPTQVRGYADGTAVKKTAALTTAVTGNGNNFSIGAIPGGNNQSFHGKFDETRILKGVALSEDWIAAEYANETRTDFLTAGPLTVRATDGLLVSGSPAAYGTATPDYGLITGLADQQVVSCTAPDALRVTDTLQVAPMGYKLYHYDSDGNREAEPYFTSDTGVTSFDYVHTAGTLVQLEWQFVQKVPLVLSATRAVDFLVDGAPAVAGTNWVSVGSRTVETIATTGTEGTDWTFGHWSGDVGSAATGATNITVSVSAATSLQAEYSSRVSVSTAGSDETGVGTQTSPWRTIGKAVGICGSLDEIRVCGGLYEENIHIENKPFLVLRGGYRSDGTRDLAGSPTVVRAADATSPVLALWHSASNVVDGLALTGGNLGVHIVKSTRQRLTRLAITNNTDSGIFYQTQGNFDPVKYPSVWEADAFIEVSSCLIADNGKCGIRENLASTDWYLQEHVIQLVNDTIVGNGSDGATIYLAFADVVNCIVSGNGGAGLTKTYTYSSKCYDLVNSCVVGNAGGDLPVTRNSHELLHFRGGNLFSDPALTDGYALSAASRCLKRGCDPADWAPSVDTDLVGRPWNGAYDMGCFGSSSPAVETTTYPEVWVASDGDDANAGDSPSTAVATLAEGLFRTAAGGVCHVGPGVFSGTAECSRDGVRIVGAGARKTTLTQGSGKKYTVLAVSASNVRLEGVTVSNGRVGVQVAHDGLATNVQISACRLVDNWRGVDKSTGCLTSRPSVSLSPVTRITTSVFVGNSQYGLRAYNLSGEIRCDSCLFASNGTAKATDASCLLYKSFGWLENCTFLDSVGTGLYTDGSWNDSARVYNCIFDGNDRGYFLTGYTRGGGLNCLFNNTSANWALDDTKYDLWTGEGTNTFAVADTLLNRGKGRFARPLAGSPAYCAGTNINETESARVTLTRDLNGRTFDPDEWDVGCYSHVLPGLCVIIR